jgi:hypothetical protein
VKCRLQYNTKEGLRLTGSKLFKLLQVIFWRIFVVRKGLRNIASILELILAISRLCRISIRLAMIAILLSPERVVPEYVSSSDEAALHFVASGPCRRQEQVAGKKAGGDSWLQSAQKSNRQTTETIF